MPFNAYLTLRGQKQGDIKGGATKKGREGSIPLISVAYEVERRLDWASGLPTGKRIHQADHCRQGHRSGEPETPAGVRHQRGPHEHRIEFWRPVPEVVSPYFIIVLANALLAGIALAPSGEDVSNEYEQVQSTFQRSAGPTRRRAIRPRTIGAPRHEVGATQASARAGPFREEGMEVLAAAIELSDRIVRLAESH